MILTPELVRLLHQVEVIRTILGLAISKMNQPWEEMAFIKGLFCMVHCVFENQMWR